MTRTRTLLGAATAALLIGVLGACSTPPGGGGGGGGLTAGCFPSALGGSVRLTAAGSYYDLTVYSSSNCSGGGSTPVPVYAGSPGPNALSTCISVYGPGTTVTDDFGNLLIPQQTFWFCNRLV